MAYNNTVALLNSGKNIAGIVHYDFKNEHGRISFSEDNIEFWLNYRNKGDTWDCDGSGSKPNKTCRLSRDIYKVLWGWESKIENRYKKTSSFHYMCMGPDTMNSYFKILTRVVEFVDPEGKKQYFESIKGKKHWSKKDTSQKGFLDLVDKVRVHNEVGVLLNKYAYLTHTFGNFVLVPAGFNSGRVRATDDYWDLSLRLMKDDPEWMPPELFQKYINTFFLWDYVDENYEIKPFFNLHSFQKKNPNDLQESIQLLQTIINYIVRRGYFMVAMLKVATKHTINYSQILNELSNMKKANMKNAVEIVKDFVNEDQEIFNILNKYPFDLSKRK